MVHSLAEGGRCRAGLHRGVRWLNTTGKHWNCFFFTLQTCFVLNLAYLNILYGNKLIWKKKKKQNRELSLKQKIWNETFETNWAIRPPGPGFHLNTRATVRQSVLTEAASNLLPRKFPLVGRSSFLFRH